MSFTGRRCPFGGRRPGPRRLVRTPVAVHLLPSEKVAIIAGRARARRAISLSVGERGHRKAVGEGSLPNILDRPSESFHHFAHELVGVFQHHRIRNAQQSNAEGPQIIFFGSIFAHLIDLSVDAAIEFKGEPMFEALKICERCAST
jgi:hypothetical protein